MSAHTDKSALAAATMLAIALLAFPGCGSSGGSSSSSSATSPASPATSATTTQPPEATLTSPGLVTGTAGGVTATMQATTHQPRVNRPWPLHLTATSGGQPAHAAVDYEFVFGGQVVAHRSHYTFVGHFSDTLLWPSSAVGYPLTFRAAMTANGATINLDYAVKVTP
jgi:hypothetical protein